MATASFYGLAIKSLFEGRIDIATDTFKLMLLDGDHVPNIDTHQFLSHVSADEVTAGGGYTAGGITLTNVTGTYNAATDTFTIDADNPSWGETTTISAAYGVVYDDTPATAATKPLLCLLDFEGVLSSNNGPFSVQWHADGIATASLQAA